MTKHKTLADVVLLAVAFVELFLAGYYRFFDNTPEATFYLAAAATTLLLAKL